MRSGSDTQSANISTSISTDPVDKAILNSLSSGPKKAGALKKEVMEAVGCSASKFHKRLAVLRDDTRQILDVQSGRDRYYSLPFHKDELMRTMKRQGKLEQLVVEDAQYLLNHMMRGIDYRRGPEDLTQEIVFKALLLSQTVDALSESYPDLPRLAIPDPDKLGGRTSGIAIMALHKSLLDVLRFLKQL